MAYKKGVLVAAFVALAGAMAFGSAVQARNGSEVATEKRANQIATESDTETTSLAEGMSDAQKQIVESRRGEMKDRLEKVRPEHVTKLADKRLEQCKKHQETINQNFDRGVERNQKQLLVIRKIEDRVKAFYVEKQLTAVGYDDVVKMVDEAEAAAVAALEISASTQFDCASTDSAHPGIIVRETMLSRHTALKNYRTAVKDLILVVKKHNGQNRGEASTTDGTADSETKPDETPSTGGEQ